MAPLTWFAVGLAIWHFTVFVPDRFWAGIVGALLGSTVGAIITGALYQAAIGDSIGQTDIVTALVAVPGSVLGLATVYVIGARAEAEEELAGGA